MIGQTNEYSGTIYFVKPVTKVDKKAVEPYFSFKQKVDGVYKEVNQSTVFSGNLEKVETYEREWEGVKSTNVKITLVDGEEKYIVDLAPSILSRSVFNTLLSLESYENLKFTIYLTKPKPGAPERYPQISVWQNDELVKWAHALNELPAVEEIKNSKGVVLSKDYADLNQFFFDKIAQKFGKGAKPKADKPKTEKPAAETPGKSKGKGKPASVQDDSSDDQDPPFEE
jgi:hypothetical protein